MPRAVSVADFDLDGNLDFVIQARGNLSHYVYLGAGDGTFKQGSIVGNRLHQYSIGGNARISGITENIFALVPLQPGAYQAVMRACWNGTACTATSEFGWGPWNNAPGSTGGIASFTVR